MSTGDGVLKNRAFDVIIVGAGPAGCTCALTLQNAGLRVAILEKFEFPRDKVCGETLHQKGIYALRDLSPEIAAAFNAYEGKNLIKHAKAFYKKMMLTFHWRTESYVVRRLDFDAFMLSLVKKFTTTEVFTSISIEKIEIDPSGVTVRVKNEELPYTAAVIIGADGANSIVAKQLTKRGVDKKHYFGSVRAYFKNVADTNGDTSQGFFYNKYGSNYLWVFPINKEISNVGLGMLSSEIAKDKVNLKEIFYEYIREIPQLAEKFKNAEQVSPLEGFGIPLGTNFGTISGDRFMLTGDAASLSNPVAGTGMANAIVSGKLAGEQVMRSFKAQDFSAACMTGYDNGVKTRIINDLMKTFKLQQFFARVPFIMNIVFTLGQIQFCNEWLKRNV